MAPVGGIDGLHEVHVASALFRWTEADGRGIGFGPNTGFNLPDGSCLARYAAWLSLPRWNALTPEQQAGYPPLCPEFSSKSAPPPTLAVFSKRRCICGLTTARVSPGSSTRNSAKPPPTSPACRPELSRAGTGPRRRPRRGLHVADISPLAALNAPPLKFPTNFALRLGTLRLGTLRLAHP